MTWIDQIELCIDTLGARTFDLPWNSAPFKIFSKKTKIDFLDDIRKNIKKNPINLFQKTLLNTFLIIVRWN